MVQKDATVVGAGAGRVFLLLQGPMSFFFTYLAAALRDRDAVALRMLFCPGDGLFHRGGPGIAYRGRPRDWPAYAESFMRDRGVTDLVCLGDGRRWHEDGIAAARRVGARVHLVEQGYLRPHFLTVEPDGTGGRSRFPREWPAIEALAKGAKPPEPPPHRASFLGFAAMDVAFNLANLIGARILYPHYERHAIDHPAYEWAGWIWNKALKARGRARALQGAEGRLARHEGPVFLTPLQLDTDYQIRLHAPPGGVEALLRRVVASFAAHAPAEALLAVKAHPLDHGWADWGAKARAAARREGIAERLVFLDGGDLGRMLTGAAGVVVANSTVGLTALQAGVPTIALGTAIYDLPGLAHQSGLDRFWTDPTPPDRERLATFLAALGAIQVPGGFDGTGAKPGAAAAADRMLAPPPY